VTLAIPIAVVACGGGESEGAKAPTGGASSTAPSGGPSGVPAGPDAGPTTTTVALGNGGDLQGAKLTETKTVASTSAGEAPPVPKGHGHEVGRGPEDIRAIIMARRDEARACYDGAVKDHPGIEGDLVISWTIDPKGNVTQTSLDSSRSQIAEPTVVACISDLIKKVQFAASPGGYETRASYPFNFHPHHGTSSRAP
jgi:hypothetical protein